MEEVLERSLLPGFCIAGPLPGAGAGATAATGAGAAAAAEGSDHLLARHDTLGLEAAVEVFMLPDGLAADGLERLHAAASRVSELTHRNLAGLLLAGCAEDGRCFLMTERPGELTLARELQDLGPEPLPLPRALSVLTQVADGLDAAHGAGLLHRDLRPELVGFGPTKPDDAVVQLHGLGRVTLLEAAGLLPGGDADLVSPAYASPEQLDGEAGDAPADVYSLGVLAFRLCTGRLPFECASMELYREAHRESTPHSPRDRRPSYLAPLPEVLDTLILACLEKDPTDRPAPGKVSRTLAEAALEATRQMWDQRRAAAPLGVWKRIRAKAVETARYVQYVKLGREPLAEALAAFGPHDAAQQERDRAAEEAGTRWDELHGEVRGREHRLRNAVLALGLDRGRLVAQGAGDQPGAQDLARQIDELLRSVAAARGDATAALQEVTTALIRAREAAEDWARQEPNRVMELVDAVRELRDTAGDPSLHQRIDALTELVAQIGGGSVPTLPGP